MGMSKITSTHKHSVSMCAYRCAARTARGRMGMNTANDEYRRMHGVREPMVRVNERYAKRTDRFGSTNDYAGTGFEAVWWIKSPHE